MKRIDKSRYRNDFNVYSRDYLTKVKNRRGQFIPRLSNDSTFDKFNNKKYKKTAHPAVSRFHGWLDILLVETENRCCYCMRHLSGNDISVEHLVPENFNGLVEQDEYNYYAGISPDIQHNVELGSDFDANAQANANNINGIVKFPHLIAHSNLFPACKNDTPGCSCNNHRGNKRILPLMLMNNVANIVSYNEEGEVEILYTDIDMVEKTLRALDVNTRELKLIRKLWYLFSRKNIHPQNQNATFPDADTWLRQALNIGKTDVIPLEYQDFIKVEADGSLRKFNLFLQYDWFYTYYLTKYP